MQRLRRYFITGFFVIVPLLISVYALVKIFEVVDGLTTPLYDQLLHRRVPGLGTLTTVVVILLTGVFATNVIGRRVLQRTEGRLPRRPPFPAVHAPVTAAVVAVLAGGWFAGGHIAAQTPQPESRSERAVVQEGGGGEANLILPDLSQVAFRGVNSRTLLSGGLAICVLGLLFGLRVFTQTKNLPVHPAMREISELIYETCKTYLITQGKFILVLEVFIGVIIVLYFGMLQHLEAIRVVVILIFSLIGIGGS